mmetsp:Transcript_12701/g.27435  ORF Transcript_12701/g.27435 Transcript_12701/m.27435 type:complete len:375 (+) Transcript_12701:326-1450(+)
MRPRAPKILVSGEAARQRGANGEADDECRRADEQRARRRQRRRRGRAAAAATSGRAVLGLLCDARPARRGLAHARWDASLEVALALLHDAIPRLRRQRRLAQLAAGAERPAKAEAAPQLVRALRSEGVGDGRERHVHEDRARLRVRLRLEQHPPLLSEQRVAELHAQVGHVRLANVVARDARVHVVGTEPGCLNARLERRLQHRVARDLCQIARREAPHLLRDAVLLHERLLRVVEHERIVRRERNVQANREKLMERVFREAEEEGVVRERREGEADLSDVVEVLQRRRLAQVDAVRDAARRQKSRVKVVELTGLARVRAEAKRGKPLRVSKLVEDVQVGVQVVAVVGIMRVARLPLLGVRSWVVVRRQHAFGL